jgi:hypothetical protein
MISLNQMWVVMLVMVITLVFGSLNGLGITLLAIYFIIFVKEVY